MKVAGLDLGTNTFLMLVADVSQKGIQEIISDEIEITRLGQGVNATGLLHPDALKRAEACLSRYRRRMDELGIKTCVAVATSAARDAKNSHELKEIMERYQIPVRIISGAQEAKVTFEGTLFDRKDLNGIGVIDIGGGSTEITIQQDGELISHSFDIGSVRLTEKFITGHPVAPTEIKAIEKFIQDTFATGPLKKEKLKTKELVAVAGTPTTMAAVVQGRPYKESKIEGFVLQKKELKQWRDRMAAMNLTDRQNMAGMERDRADVIVVGLTILTEAMDFLNVSQITVSARGVRYGVVLFHEEILRAEKL